MRPSAFIQDIDYNLLECVGNVVQNGQTTPQMLPKKTFDVGDKVEHKIFGVGTIVDINLSTQSYEIDFEKLTGTRKIMFRAELKRCRLFVGSGDKKCKLSVRLTFLAYRYSFKLWTTLMNSYYTDRKMSVIIRQNKGSRRKHKVSQLYTPFRYDFVGSFLRPEYLKKARADYEAGTINAEELKKQKIRQLQNWFAKQKEAGYHVITDGEFRRATWHLDFMWAFDGVGHSKTETGLPFHGEDAMIDDTYVTGKISYKKNHPFVEHFKFVKALEDENTVAKLTIPAPAQFLEQMIMPFAWSNTKKFYDTQEEVAKDIAEGYREFIKEVYAAGCRNLQLDDCSWGMVVDPAACKLFGVTPKGLEKIKEQLLEINNSALEGKPEDLIVNTHVCRGNFHSTYAKQRCL